MDPDLAQASSRERECYPILHKRLNGRPVRSAPAFRAITSAGTLIIDGAKAETHPFTWGEKVQISDEVSRNGGLIAYIDGYTRIGDDWTVRLVTPNDLRQLSYHIQWLTLVEPAS